MKRVEISLKNIHRVKELVAILERYPFEVDICSGRYVVDGKSLLGIFSLDLSKPVQMNIYQDDCGKLLEEIASYLVPDGQTAE